MQKPRHESSNTTKQLLTSLEITKFEVESLRPIAASGRGEEMKREVVKGITMVTMIVAIALAMAVVSANAQSSRTVISNVPFEFVVGDTILPAGEYRIGRTVGNALTIQTPDASGSATRLTNDIQPRKDREQARLIFRRYGQYFFLAEVWTGPDSMGWQVLKSRQERAIERENSSLAPKTEQAECGYEIVQVVAVLR
jgi:hypothetical protein